MVFFFCMSVATGAYAEVPAVRISHNLTFPTVPAGTMKYAEFMSRVGTIKASPASWKDLFFAPIQGAAGSY